MSLIERTKAFVLVAPNSGAAATMTPITADMTGFDRALVLVCGGVTGGSGAALDAIQVKEAATAGATASSIAGAVGTVNTNGNIVIGIDFPVNPDKPHIVMQMKVGTATFANGVIALAYNGSRTYPVSGAYTETVVI